MTEIANRYRRLAEAFAAKVAAVPDDRWASPSPCADWDAREIVGHVLTTQGMFLGFVGRDLGDIPLVDVDPAGAWDAARAVVQANLDDPELATAEFDGFAGRTTREAGADRFLSTDLVVHGWDLARAAGLDERIDPAEVERVRREMSDMGDMLRGPGAFGPEIEPVADADDQTRMLNFLGRQT